jgi:hypothetical protein
VEAARRARNDGRTVSDLNDVLAVRRIKSSTMCWRFARSMPVGLMPVVDFMTPNISCHPPVGRDKAIRCDQSREVSQDFDLFLVEL